MRIGIDFDNTIICYDRVFNEVGIRLGLLPENLPEGKTAVRDYLRQANLEDEWTKMQGYVYGKCLKEAFPFNGVKEFVQHCRRMEIPCVIVSHKTKFPYAGKPYNLHEAAADWIKDENIMVPFFFEATQQKKIERVNHEGCTHFIDDLPEFLNLPGFNSRVQKILFDPGARYTGSHWEFEQMGSWFQIIDRITAESEAG